MKYRQLMRSPQFSHNTCTFMVCTERSLHYNLMDYN